MNWFARPEIPSLLSRQNAEQTRKVEISTTVRSCHLAAFTRTLIATAATTIITITIII
jgi:hypothetical protein